MAGGKSTGSSHAPPAARRASGGTRTRGHFASPNPPRPPTLLPPASFPPPSPVSPSFPIPPRHSPSLILPLCLAPVRSPRRWRGSTGRRSPNRACCRPRPRPETLAGARTRHSAPRLVGRAGATCRGLDRQMNGARGVPESPRTSARFFWRIDLLKLYMSVFIFAVYLAADADDGKKRHDRFIGSMWKLGDA